MRGVISSRLYLPNFLRVTNCDIAIICEHKLKQSSLLYMNSIDTRYQSVSKTYRLNDSFNCTHDKGWIYIMYNSSLQFSVKEMAESNRARPINAERIIDNEVKIQNYR